MMPPKHIPLVKKLKIILWNDVGTLHPGALDCFAVGILPVWKVSWVFDVLVWFVVVNVHKASNYLSNCDFERVPSDAEVLFWFLDSQVKEAQN